MTINYDILQNLLRCNKNLKLQLENNILNVTLNYEVVYSLRLDTNSIEENCELIYNTITSLDGITIYIPKVYGK